MQNQKKIKPELLGLTLREHSIETLHYGWICAINKDKKVIYKRGKLSDYIFLRSSAKPIQAIRIIDNELNFTLKELAITCASHSGSNSHLALLKKSMSKFRIKNQDLRCGIHMPLDDEERNYLIRKNLKPNPLHNNCSGKHIGMLCICKKNDWDLKTYLSPNHLLQKRILKIIKTLSETKNVKIAVDGCGVPTFSLPVINIAKMFSNFTDSKNKQYSNIISAMTKYPLYAGSKNQIDTEIMRAAKGKLIAKVGAEGIIIVAGGGNSLVVKIADGSPRVRSFIVLKLLLKLGWLKKKDINGVLKGILSGKIKNHAGIST